MTVSDIVDALGGTSATARLFGLCRSAVSNWRADKRIPPKWHYRLSKECERRRIKLPPGFFENMPEQRNRP